MKLLFLLLFFASIGPAYGQDWIPASSPPLKINGSVHMADTSTIYLTGENKIYKSTDRANSWKMVWESDSALKTILTVTTSKTGRLYSAYDLFNTIWAKLIYSDDGGTTWEEKSVPFVDEPQVIHFHNNDIGFVGGDERLAMTEDGGETWKIVASKSGINFYTIQFMTDSIGILAGGAEPRKVLFRTEDGGKTWKEVFASGLEHYRAQFPTENVGYVASLNSVSKSTDGGESWTKLNMPVNENYFQLYFPTADVGYVTTSDYLTGGWDYGSKIFKTINGGNTWTEQTVDEEQLYRIHDIDFNGRYGIMVGEVRGVYVTELDRLLESKDVDIINQPISVYPNPVYDLLNVNIPQGFAYKIFRPDGRMMKSGSMQKSTIDVTDLESGMYLLLLSSKNSTRRTTFVKS